MSERKKQNNRNVMQDGMTSKGRSRQGNDKAPGEEVAHDTQNVVQDTQKGENKVDGDPARESDQPIAQSRY